MNREQKAEVIEEIAARIAESDAIYAVDYRGISVAQAAALRASLREADASFRIVKNTLTLRAAEQAGAELVGELVEGPTALAFVRGDAALAAKTLDGFARRERILELRGGILGGESLSADAVRELARLPGRHQLNGQLTGLVAAPLTGLVRGLGAFLSGLAIALKQVQDQKQTETGASGEAQGEAPSEPQEEAPSDAQAPSDDVQGAPSEAPGDAPEVQEETSSEAPETAPSESREEASSEAKEDSQSGPAASQ